MWRYLLIGLVMGCAIGCGGADASSDADGQSPREVARENARLAEETIRESDKGLDESGDRVWKQEARAFFDFGKYPDNRTFELPSEWARDFVETMYAAGALKVWVTSISEFELGDEKINISDNMVVVLPDDANKRQTIFAAHNQAMADAGAEPLADIGQDYLLVSGD